MGTAAKDGLGLITWQGGPVEIMIAAARPTYDIRVEREQYVVVGRRCPRRGRHLDRRSPRFWLAAPPFEAAPAPRPARPVAGGPSPGRRPLLLLSRPVAGDDSLAFRRVDTPAAPAPETLGMSDIRVTSFSTQRRGQRIVVHSPSQDVWWGRAQEKYLCIIASSFACVGGCSLSPFCSSEFCMWTLTNDHSQAT